jgi:hypothetical protein
LRRRLDFFICFCLTTTKLKKSNLFLNWRCQNTASIPQQDQQRKQQKDFRSPNNKIQGHNSGGV